MKAQDLAAIQEMNPSQHLYLEVVGKGKEQHLKCTKKNWLGRLWMKLGFSSASMSKVASYIALKEHEQFSLPSIQPDQEPHFDLLISKVRSYTRKHAENSVAYTSFVALNVLLQGSNHLLLEKLKIGIPLSQFQKTSKNVPGSNHYNRKDIYLNLKDSQEYVLSNTSFAFYINLLFKLILKENMATPLLIQTVGKKVLMGKKYEPTYQALSQESVAKMTNTDDLAKIAVASFLLANLEINSVLNPHSYSDIGTINVQDQENKFFVTGFSHAFRFYNPHWGNTFVIDAQWRKKIIDYWQQKGVTFTLSQIEKAGQEIAEIPIESFIEFCDFGESLSQDEYEKGYYDLRQMRGLNKTIKTTLIDRIARFKTLVMQ